MQKPTVDGQDAWGRGVKATRASPVFAWQPPVRGKPTIYWLTVHELTAVEGVAVQKRVVSVSTADTAIRLPPGVLQAGKTYVAWIRAEDGTDASVAGTSAFSLP